MSRNNLRRYGVLSLLFLALIPFAVGCGKKEPTRWDETQKESSQEKKAVVSESTKGAELNAYFPKQEAPYDLVYKQEKKGLVQANIKKDGKDVASLSVSDTRNNPDAAKKYESSATKLGEYPSIAVGNMGTAVLVGVHQVQVRSLSPSFSKDDREAWIQKFDLAGLAQLK